MLPAQTTILQAAKKKEFVVETFSSQSGKSFQITVPAHSFTYFCRNIKMQWKTLPSV